MKKIFIGLFLLSLSIFACEYPNMHEIGLILINKNLVEIKGNDFIVYFSKLDSFIETNKLDENTILLIALTLEEFPKQHNLNIKKK